MKDIFNHVHQLSKQGEYQAILNELLAHDQSVIVSPYDTDENHAWYLVGNAYFKLKNYQQAISSFKRAIECWQDDKDGYLALANSYSDFGLPKKAEQVLRTALKKWPSDEKFVYNMGNALFDQKKYQDSIIYYEKVLSDFQLVSMANKNIKEAKKMVRHKNQ